MREPRPGLDFARNCALRECRNDLLAFLDDDVVADRGWLLGLLEAWRENPDAGAFTGLVLPLELGSRAQILFESCGGFGRGFEKIRYGPTRAGNPLYPCGAGMFSAGANMVVRRDVLLQLSGFDEALDTGKPLPGGGDLDIFYRVIRAGHPLVYEPNCAVFHQHRRDMRSLQRRYHSWGLGFMAFVAKCSETDPSQRPKQWMSDRVGQKLVSGGDVEMALRIRGAGFPLWYHPGCQLQHVISSRRISDAYLCRMTAGLGASQTFADAMTWPRGFASWRLNALKEAARGVLELLLPGAKALAGRRSKRAVLASWSFARGRWAGIFALMRFQERCQLLGCARKKSQPRTARGNGLEGSVGPASIG